MPAMTDFFENNVVNHLLRNQAYTPPATVYLALFTTATNDAGGGTEVSGGSYARQAVTLTANNPTANTGAITFPQATASWGTITHVALMDALTGGNMLIHGALAASRSIDTNDTFEIADGDLDLTLD